MSNKKIVGVFLTGCFITSMSLNDSVVLAEDNNKNSALIQNQSNEKNENYIFLSDLKYISDMSNTSWSTIKINQNIDGKKITLNVEGEPLQFDNGIGAHANSNVVYDVSEYSNEYSRFTTYAGVDRSQWDKGNGVKFIVYTSDDGKVWKEVARTDVLKGNKDAAFIDVNIKGAKYLKLTANNNGNNGNDHSVYGSPRIMKPNYDISSEYVADVKKVDYYDNLIKEYNINSPIEGEYEKLLLKRTFVKRVGFNTIQSVAKLGAKYENAINWLVNNDKALKLYVTGGEIEKGGSYDTSMKAFSDIYEKHKSDFEDKVNGDLYLKMAISTSISHAKTVRLWTGNATPSDPCKRYEIYKNLYTSGLMAEGGDTNLFKNLPVELMRWVVNNNIDDEEIDWLVNNALDKKNKGQNYLDAYTYIKYTSGFNYNKDIYYDPNNYNKWNEKYNISSLSDYGTKGVHKLWMVFEDGAVCGGLAKTYANLSQVFGMPAAVVGQPGHAATLTYTQNSQGKGIWSIKNDITGWVKSEKGERLPLGWGSKDWNSRYSVSYILLAQRALDDYDNLIQAQYYNYLADVYKGDLQKQIEIYNKALEVQNYNLDSLIGLINAYENMDNKTSSDYLDLAKRIANGLAYYPLPFVDVMSLIEPNITDKLDKITFDMIKTKTLKDAKLATDKDTVQPNACKTMAEYLLGENDIELATFSFDGEDAGKIKINDIYSDSQIRWEYSLDGWKTKVETDKKEVILTPEELKKINKDTDIQISLVGTDDIYTIDITQYDTPNNLYANDLENQFRGFNGNLEYKEETLSKESDNSKWIKYDPNNTRITGNKKVIVRYASSGTIMQSEPAEYTFAEDNQPDTRKYVQLKNVSLYKYSSQQNNENAAAKNMIDGNKNTGWHNTWDGEVDKYYSVEFDKPRYITSIEYKSGGYNGRLKNVDIYTSMDGEKWVKSGEVRNLPNNDDLKTLNLKEPTLTKFIKLQAVNTYGNPNDAFFTGRMLNFFEDITKINTEPTIIAEDRTIKAGEDFDELKGVSATDKEDGDITKSIKVITNTVNTKEPGTYKVVYEVTDKQGATTRKTINVTVISNDSPIITGAEDIIIKEGKEFNVLEGIKATDTEDGDINSIEVKGTVDTSKPGDYELIYIVSDKDGNTTQVKRIVKVVPKLVEINNIPTITAEDKTIKVGEEFDKLKEVSATDVEDGNITQSIEVITDEVNTKEPGIYKVVYEVTDKQGATARKTINVTVESNDLPIITGAENISIKEGKEFNVLEGIKATDTEDGDITKRIEVKGTVDTSKPGDYELTYIVSDKDGNTTQVKRIVKVTPELVEINNIPTITAEDKTIKVGEEFDELKGVSATDTEDGDITQSIKVITNTVNTKEPGIYEVVYEVTDKQGKKSIKTIKVTVEKEDFDYSINNINTSQNSKPSNVNQNNNNNTNNEDNSSKSDTEQNPKTGDKGILGLFGLGLVSLLGLASNNRKTRKK